MKNVFAILCLGLMLILLLGTERSLRHGRPATPTADSCAACHTAEPPGISAGHNASAMGCSPCHLGNGLAFDRSRAHHGMVRNPGDLRVVDATCGRGGCHPALAGRVKRSVMATASGMLASLDALWGTQGPRDATLLWAEDSPRDPPRDYWAKLCAACHLWWPKGRGLGEQRLRGGGCTACHAAGPAPPRLENAGAFRHARLTMAVPVDNCVRCHNRSARVGLSYQGLVEDFGSGGPHTDGGLNPLRLSGGRFAARIRPDAHFEAGMACIDCHTGSEIMGDGTAHERLRGQLDVACADCHAPRFLPPPAPGRSPAGARRAEGERLAAMNPALPPLGDAPLAYTAAKGSPLYALRRKSPPKGRIPGEAVLLRKADGKALSIPLHATPQPHHALRGHERLACQACHSPLMPQCRGCHVAWDPQARQTDLLLGRETPGRWTESQDYARLLRPALALRAGGRIAPFSPCEVFVHAAGPSVGPAPEPSRVAVDLASFDPHATRSASRACLDCHLAPAPVPEGRASRYGYPGPGDRALDARERDAVLAVAPCLPCHGTYADAVYQNFAASRTRLRAGDAPRCRCPEPARTGTDGGALSSCTH
ncbi:hypothetical protein [Desulfocurvus sp. DL9XJH121]